MDALINGLEKFEVKEDSILLWMVILKNLIIHSISLF